MTPVKIENSAARRLFLARHGLGGSFRARMTRAGLLQAITSLGFVQVDSIATVERAHHMILFARNHTYKQQQMAHLLEREAAVFENWTHDASILPTAFYPFWQRIFERKRDRLFTRFNQYHGDAFVQKQQQVLAQIAEHGPQMARDFEDKPDPTSEKWGWNWHPSKAALEYLWRTGGLAVARREGFQKVYDLPERVFGSDVLSHTPTDAELVDWACAGALDRLGFASSGELAAFWNAVSPAEAADWCDRQSSDDLVEVECACADGDAKPRKYYARPSLLEEMANLPPLPGAVRVLSPFDPAIRNRRRAMALFGFDYRIEIFVPEAKRQFGYYVFPLLEGERFIGRIDMKRDRDTDSLRVSALWLEPRLKLTPARQAKLERELYAVAEFAGVRNVTFSDGYFRG